MNSVDSNAVSCKVVLLGESGVGKTSIISRYVKNLFSSNELPTPGASFASRIVLFNEFDKHVKFEVEIINTDLGYSRTREIQKSS
jgi:GTPase SAR1 family protein